MLRTSQSPKTLSYLSCLIKYIAATTPIIANKNSMPGGVGVGVSVQTGEGEGKIVVNGVVVGV